MIQPDFLYIQDATFILLDLYRFGNASTPRLDNVRSFKDVTVVNRGGIEIVVANGNGVSLSSTFDPQKRNTWVLSKNTPIPFGLSLVRDLRVGRGDHFMVAPTSNMPFAKYIGLLQELAVHCKKVS
jgi:DNA-binding beta-propeller fold protein YncE